MFYERGPYSRYLIQSHSSGSAPVDMFEAVQPSGHFPDPAFPELLLYLAIKGCKEARFDWGAGKWQGLWRAGDLTLVPANAASDVEMSDQHRFIALCFPAAAVGVLIGDDYNQCPDKFGNLYQKPFRDELARNLIMELWRLSNKEQDASGWYSDCLAGALLGRLSRLAGSGKMHVQKGDIHEIIAFIDGGLDQKLSVGVMSKEFGVPERQLQAIARERCGLSLYQLVLERRLLAARSSLLRRDSDIAEVALECGFSSQAHLTYQYSKRFGTTPARDRAKGGGGVFATVLLDPEKRSRS